MYPKKALERRNKSRARSSLGLDQGLSSGLNTLRTVHDYAVILGESRAAEGGLLNAMIKKLKMAVAGYTAIGSDELKLPARISQECHPRRDVRVQNRGR